MKKKSLSALLLILVLICSGLPSYAATTDKGYDDIWAPSVTITNDQRLEALKERLEWLTTIQGSYNDKLKLIQQTENRIETNRNEYAKQLKAGSITQAQYSEYMKQVKELEDELIKLKVELEAIGDIGDINDEMASIKDEIARITNGTIIAKSDYTYAYFPTIYINATWSGSNNAYSNTAPGEVFSYSLDNMNKYGVLDYVKNTLKVKDEQIYQVILYNHNENDTMNFPEGKVYPLNDHDGMVKGHVTIDNINTYTNPLETYVTKFDEQYGEVSTTENQISNYVWKDTLKNGSFDASMRLVSPSNNMYGFQITKMYFSEIKNLSKSDANYTTKRNAIEDRFIAYCKTYGMPSTWYTDIIDSVNAGKINVSGDVQAYCYYTLQVWVVAIKDGGDISPPSISLTQNGTKVNGPILGEDHCVEIEIENTNTVEIGADPSNGNDKVNPLVTIIDNKTGNTIYRENVKATQNIPKKGTIKVKVCGVKLDTSEIKVCTNVDPDGTYNKAGLNTDTSNDVLCKVFKTVQDMGMSQKMSLSGPAGVDMVSPGGNHTITVYPKHVVGTVPIGLDKTINPMATVDLKITTLGGKAIYEKTLQASQVLKLNSNVPVTFNNVKIDSPQIKVCATLNKIHEEKYFNLNNGNDTYCQTYGSVRNYAVKDFKVSPSLVYSSAAVTKNIEFTFSIANEASKSEQSLSPSITIKQNGKVIWSKNMAIEDGETITITQNISVNLASGTNNFEVEVNGNRAITEYRSNGDPYGDNKKTATVTVQLVEKCETCVKSNNKNNWRQTFSVFVRDGEPYEYEMCDATDEKGLCIAWETVEGCRNSSIQRDSTTIDFYEKYQVKNILFRSKYTKDKDTKGDGWVDLANGGKAVIKAGYGFELAVLTTYETNRYTDYESYRKSFSPVPPFYSNSCSYGSISPQVSSVEQPSYISLKLPFTNTSQCYQLQATQKSGNWYNSAYLFELPQRKSLTGNTWVRMIYINENAKASVNNFTITTPQWLGYQESGVSKSKLQQCITSSITVLANDDLHGHLTS